MEMLKVAARNSERFDGVFLLLRDLAVEENVRRFLVNMNGVSNLINLLLNDMAPQFLVTACGSIQNMNKVGVKPKLCQCSRLLQLS